MKLTGNLKKQVESAPTKEEKREAIKQASMLLSDDELDQVAGGVPGGRTCPYNPGCPKVGIPFQCKQETCPWAQGLI